MSEFQYQGSELDIFALASNWKSYWAGIVRPFVVGNVLDVGCGIGNNIGILYDRKRQECWTALDPDAALVNRTEERFAGTLGDALKLEVGTVASYLEENPQARFDSVIYIDVLEHIEKDKEELLAAMQLLGPDGSLVVLSPAMPFLYSPFDEAVGHFRRYTKGSLRSVAPPILELKVLRYLDVTGCALSAGNRLFLRNAEPTEKQILFWDRTIIPISRVVDPVLSWAFGRSVVGIWKRNDDAP